MEPFAVYKDIQARTKGQFLLGVVGPVRTGKSTFIRRFMELLALPGMEEQDAAEVRDQLPVSGSGKTITTVEPKFIPKEAVNVNLGEEIPVKIRLIILTDIIQSWAVQLYQPMKCVPYITVRVVLIRLKN